MKITLIAKKDFEIYDMLGVPKKVKKGCSLLGELTNINGLKLITIVSLDNFEGVYDESVVKEYFDIQEDE